MALRTLKERLVDLRTTLPLSNDEVSDRLTQQYGEVLGDLVARFGAGVLGIMSQEVTVPTEGLDLRHWMVLDVDVDGVRANEIHPGQKALVANGGALPQLYWRQPGASEVYVYWRQNMLLKIQTRGAAATRAGTAMAVCKPYFQHGDVEIPSSSPLLQQFGDTSVWTKGTGWILGEGIATSDGSQSGNSDLVQTISVVESLSYEVRFRVSRRTAGQITVILGGGTAGTAVTEDGDYAQVLKAGSGTTFVIRADTSFVGEITEVTLRAMEPRLPREIMTLLVHRTAISFFDDDAANVRQAIPADSDLDVTTLPTLPAAPSFTFTSASAPTITAPTIPALPTLTAVTMATTATVTGNTSITPGSVGAITVEKPESSGSGGEVDVTGLAAGDAQKPSAAAAVASLSTSPALSTIVADPAHVDLEADTDDFTDFDTYTTGASDKAEDPELAQVLMLKVKQAADTFLNNVRQEGVLADSLFRNFEKNLDHLLKNAELVDSFQSQTFATDVQRHASEARALIGAYEAELRFEVAQGEIDIRVALKDAEMALEDQIQSARNDLERNVQVGRIDMEQELNLAKFLTDERRVVYNRIYERDIEVARQLMQDQVETARHTLQINITNAAKAFEKFVSEYAAELGRMAQDVSLWTQKSARTITAFEAQLRAAALRLRNIRQERQALAQRYASHLGSFGRLYPPSPQRTPSYSLVG